MVLNKFLITILLLLVNICCYGNPFVIDDIKNVRGTKSVQLLGNDTLICGQSYWDIKAMDGYDFYHWSSGECGQEITLQNSGNYILTAGCLTTNLIKNGDFEEGNTAYLTEYELTSESKFKIGQYSITAEPIKNKKFQICMEPFGVGGNVMAVKKQMNSDLIVWSQEVTTGKNKDYLFTFWVSTGNKNTNEHLDVFINGEKFQSTVYTNEFNCSWKKICVNWNSGKSKNTKIEIKSSSDGDDLFLLDNIQFSTVKSFKDDINVTIDPIHINAGPDLTSCTNDLEVITVLCNDPNANFIWNTGNTETSITPETTGIYSIIATSENGCKVYDSVFVDIITVNWEISRVYSTPTYCNGSYGSVTVETEGEFDDFPYYTWSGPGAFSSNDISSPIWRNLEEGLYFVTVRSGSCFHFDSVIVLNEGGPVASFKYEILNNPREVHFINTSENGNLYAWDFGNGEKITINNLSDHRIIFNKPGVYTVRLSVTRPGCKDDEFIQKIRIN